MQNNKEILVIVCKCPTPGKVKTRLAEAIGDVAAATVCQSMLLDLIEHHRDQSYNLVLETDDLSKLGLLKDLVCARKENGNSLRGKNSILWNLFKYYCHKYERVIAIFADVPFIDSNIVRDGFEKLNKCDVVLGPCENEGYYLIGMSHPIDLFTWHKQGRHPYYQGTIFLIKERSLVYQELPTRWDIDTIEDIKRINWHSLKSTCPNTQRALLELDLL